MPPVHPDFKEFLELLNAHEVEYLIVGGYAVGYYGYARATADLDIWVAVHTDNAAKLLTVFQEFGFRAPGLTAADFMIPDNIVHIGVAPVRIEVHMGIDGVTFEECFAQQVQAQLGDVPVNLINLESLRRNKAASGRPKDLNDLVNLPEAQ